MRSRKSFKRFEHVEIVKGAGRGIKLGVPTINFDTSRVNNLKEGIYVCRVFLPAPFWGVLHFGPRPTFGEGERTLEVLLFDFENDGRVAGTADIEIIDFIREIIKFDSPQEMVKKIGRDVEAARAKISDFIGQKVST